MSSISGWRKMRIRLKNINSRRKKLADGTFKTYYWFGKGGPALPGEPGSVQFMHAYNEAVARKVVPPAGKLLSVLQAYQASEDFRGLSTRSRDDYIGKIKIIEEKFGSFPLSGLTEQRTRGIFKGWRDKLALKSRRQADYAYVVLARVLSWGLDQGLVPANPCVRGGRVYRGSRAENIWMAADEAAFLERAPAHLHLPLMLALWTGQRQGDLLKLLWSAYDGTHIRLRQSKGGVRVVIRVGAPLKALLDATPKRAMTVLTALEGKPWTPDGFRASWGKARKAAGVVGVTFHDLRGTAVTRLFLAEATEAERACNPRHPLLQQRPGAW
jgi:integrase